jgi:phospholipid transport system substrate-binding protein
MYTLRTFRVLCSALLVTVMLAVGPTASTTEDGRSAAFALIQGLGNEAIGQLSDPAISPSQREARFRRLLNDHFDMAGISRFVLGRYYRSANEAQRVEFQRLFVDFVVRAYAARFGENRGERFNVTGSSVESGGTILVRSKIAIPSSEEIQVDWRLRGAERNLAIVDIVVEGVSMAVTQRSEFASMIQSRGGVAGAIEALRATNLQSANMGTGQ